MNKFEYMIRVTIVPNNFEDERIAELIRCCKKYNYDEVMFFINAENLNIGHIKIDALKPYVSVIKKAKQQLDLIGVKTSLNPWNSLLGCDRGRTLQSGQDFNLMVDVDGKVSTATACPLSESWKNYFAEYYSYLVNEINPNIIWIEDDFRLHNHAPLNYGGCFCEQHMQLYNKELKQNVTRKQFVDGMLSGAENNSYRKAYQNISCSVMCELAEYIHSEINARCKKNVKIGLMSSDPKCHSLEGRDWLRIMNAFSNIDRIHLPSYRQDCAQNYCWSFNDISMCTRALLPNDCAVYPEVENAKFSAYTKSVNFTRFQVESSIALAPSGITLDLDCFCGNGVVDTYNYGGELKNIKPYLNTVSNLKLDFSSLSGVIIPINKNSFAVTSKKGAKNMTELCPNDNWWASQCASWGISFCHSVNESFANKVLAISGDYFRNLSTQKIISMFKDNVMLLEGNAVKCLFDLKLEYLINAASFKVLESEDGECSYEQASNKKYLGINNARTSMSVTCPSYLAINYNSSFASYSQAFDHFCNKVGEGIVKTNNAIILPYLCTTKHHGLLTNFREEAIKIALSEIDLANKPIYSLKPYMSVYHFKGNNAIILVNFADDGYCDIPLINFKPKKLFAINRKTGKRARIKFNITSNGIRLKASILPCATMVLIYE